MGAKGKADVLQDVQAITQPALVVAGASLVWQCFQRLMVWHPASAAVHLDDAAGGSL